MGKVWILDTSTKGTGAEMVPLEKTLEQPVPRRRLPPRARPRPRPAAPRKRREFKVVDAMTRETVVDGVTTAAAVEALKPFRSVVDVSVFVREDGRWRPLTLPERKALWALRAR